MTAGIRFLANVFVTAAISCALAAHAQTVVAPLPVTGPYPVACTNVEQDFSRVASGETPEMYWRGSSGDGKERYVDALLTSPAGALTATFTAPGDADLFDRWAGKPVTYVFIACYPTSPDNTRADYVLPRGTVVPKMQRGNEAPILPAGTPTWPVLLYSHGYAGSPLETDYLRALTAFASWGYVAVAPFHGDLRYSVFGPSESAALATKLYVPIWSEFVAMQAIRPLSLSAGLDLLLARPEWRDASIRPRRGLRHQPGRRDADAARRRAAQLRYLQVRNEARDAGYARAGRRGLHPLFRRRQRAGIRQATRPVRRACHCRSSRCRARPIRSRLRTSCTRGSTG